MQYKLIHGIENNISYLQSLWNQLHLENIPKPFEFEKITQWWNSYHDINNSIMGYNKKPLFVIGFERSHVKCVLPLMLVKRKRLKLFSLLYLELFSQ